MRYFGWLALALMLGISAIPAPQFAGAQDTKAAASVSALLDLNTATADELNALPGISAAISKAIVEGRPYASMDDFLSKGIVPKSAYYKFRDHVTVAGGETPQATKKDKSATAATPLGPVDLNTATADELNALPGISADISRAIIEGRPYASMDDFLSKGIVPKSVYYKFRDHVTVAEGRASTSETTGEANPPEPTGTIDLNTATADELNALPGISADISKAIIEGRPYASMDDFLSKGIVPKSVYYKFRDHVTVAEGRSSTSETTGEANPPEPTGTIDLNTATADELNALPGISADISKAIIEGRPYASMDDFLSKGIVPKSVYYKFRDHVTVAEGRASTSETTGEANPPEPTGTIDLNTATADELNALPGISADISKAIIEGRPYASMDDFLSKGIVPKSVYYKFRDHVTVAGGEAPEATKSATAATPSGPVAKKKKSATAAKRGPHELMATSLERGGPGRYDRRASGYRYNWFGNHNQFWKYCYKTTCHWPGRHSPYRYLNYGWREIPWPYGSYYDRHH